jgi:cell division protein FtsX
MGRKKEKNIDELIKEFCMDNNTKDKLKTLYFLINLVGGIFLLTLGLSFVALIKFLISYIF